MVRGFGVRPRTGDGERFSVLSLHSAAGVLVLATCSLATSGCSKSTPSPAANPNGIDPALLTDLQTVAALGNDAGGAPLDARAQWFAARMSDLDTDQQRAQLTADMLAQSESDPAYAPHAADLEVQRQTELQIASGDLAQIQSLQAAAVAAGYPSLGADGGAESVIQARIASDLSAQAQSMLASIARGASPPTATDVANFIQEVAILDADNGPAGHSTLARAIVTEILADAGAEGGAP